jgi:hypothetical protein
MDGRWNRIPDGIDPIVGYRAWYYEIGQREARLHPITQGSGVGPKAGAWDGASWGWVTAMCSLVGPASWHVAPMEDCSCGFYAMHELQPVVQDAAQLHVWRNLGLASTTGVVLGRVELAGKIIEHDRGYRAERARIAELIPFRGTGQSVMILAARLGLPISEPVDMPSMHERLGGSPGQPQETAPRFRDYLWEHRWMTGTLLVGLVVVALAPAMITTVTLFGVLFANKLDQGSYPEKPTSLPRTSRVQLPRPPGCQEVHRRRLRSRRESRSIRRCVSPATGWMRTASPATS